MPIEISRDHLDRILRAVWRDAPDRLLRFALRAPSLTVRQVLDSQAAQARKGVDAICEAEDADGRFIAHVAFEANAHPAALPARMWASGALLHADTGLPVRASILFLEPTRAPPRSFQLRHGRRLLALYRYEVVRLWSVPSATLAQDPELAVLSPLGAGATLQHLAQARDTLRRTCAPPALWDRLTALYAVSGRRFDLALLQRLFSEDQLMQSVTYQDIYEQGERRGAQRGLERLRALLLRQAEARFPGSDLISPLQACPDDALDELGLRLITAPDATAVERWLREGRS